MISAREQRRAVAVVAVIAAGVLMSGCSLFGSEGHRREVAVTTTRANDPDQRLCSMLEIPLEHVGPGHRSFVEVVRDPTDREAIGSMLYLVILAEPKSAGRFAPALDFIARRTAISLGSEGHQTELPTPTDSIVANAEELDWFLADGGCG